MCYCAQVDGQMFESQWSLDQLPKLVKHIAQVLADPNTRLVVAASPGCQEYAAAVAVAHAVHNEGLTHYAALVQLQHARHLLKVMLHVALTQMHYAGKGHV